MKTDLYTKTVLTIIALALICIVFQNFDVVSPLNASVPNVTTNQTDVIDVRIVGLSSDLEFPVKSNTGYSFESKYGLPVYIKGSNSTIPVKVENAVSIYK